jgi:polyisoprenyl-phosphate glycosyltransferase
MRPMPEVEVSVVAPVFNEEETLPELRSRLDAMFEDLDVAHEIVFVDDGSTDRSAEIVEEWARAEAGVVLVQLSRNFGMEAAMSAGLAHTTGAHVVLLPADLQDPPELIPEMLAAAREGADVVYARRIGRDESAVKRLLATAFYAVMERLARVPYQGQAGDFRVMSRRVVDAVLQMPERRRFLRGMLAWVGFEQVPIEYRRAGRRAGRGASYPQLFRLATEAVTSFSDVPLSLATYLGTLTATVSAVGAVVVIVLALTGVVNASISVWVLVAVLFLGGVQLMSIGILGRYMARVHEQTLQRPLYLVSRVVSRRQPGG